ncbi:MAG: CDP-glycerol glycerophosphotransferase family protein [Lachnospiraceae bacterium]|nr:CDP-glycerol glycerophosphotransferase family protein [Lachnospiraceae bacterium]
MGMKKTVRGWISAAPFVKVRHFLGHRRDDLEYFLEYPALYRREARRPVEENKVVMIEVRLEGISNNFTLLHRELTGTYGLDVHVHHLRTGFVGHREYRRRCRALIRDLATAKYVLINEGSLVLSCLPLRKETVCVQTWHACGAFKRFGMSTGKYLFGMDEKRQRRHPQYRGYTFATVSSPEVVWAYAEAFDMKEMDYEKVIRPLGVSRTDIYFDPAARDRAFAHLYQAFPAARGKKVILYAPTFRGRVADGITADRLDAEAFYRALGEEYVLITKHHPVTKKLPELPEELVGSFVYDATRSLSIEDLLLVSDVCISDYSSLIYEYSLLERPMLFFAYDLEEYYDWRGFYYSYEELTPGPVCRTNEELIDWIAHLEERFDRQQVIDFKDRFMSACDGHATERILKEMKVAEGSTV